MEVKKGFTLAEVLITLAIIGVVAAMTIPAVIVNTNQMEFKTGLRKAVSVLNSAITMNKALTGESPYDNSDLYNYLQQHMAVMKSKVVFISGTGNVLNASFYTTDGMRFEFPRHDRIEDDFPLYGSDVVAKGSTDETYNDPPSGNCGSMGLTHNPDMTTEPPCVVIVDVNGDRKPYPPANPYTEVNTSNGWEEYYYSSIRGENTYPKPNDRLLKDIFPILITDQGAIPYGVVAQKAMYQAQK